MTQTANQTLTDVHDMVVVHRVFRREFRLLPQLVRGVAPGDTARATVVAGHARRCLTGLHLHHSGEDDLLWPKLLERAAPETALIERMEAQHERVHDCIEKLTPALDRWEAEARPAVTEEVATTFDALADALLEHLDEEERSILPLAAVHVSQEEWNELGAHASASMSKKDLPFMFAAIIEEATPEEAAGMTAVLPPPVRLLMRLVFLPRYRREIRKIRGGS